MTTLIDYLAEFYGTNNLFLYKRINQSSKGWIVYKTTAKLLGCEIVVSFNPLIHREHLPSVFGLHLHYTASGERKEVHLNE